VPEHPAGVAFGDFGQKKMKKMWANAHALRAI
jgi:hypothetical protein